MKFPFEFSEFHLKSLKSKEKKGKKRRVVKTTYTEIIFFFSLRVTCCICSFPHSSYLVRFNCLVKHLLLTNNTELNILPCLSDSLLLLSSLFSVGEPELLKSGPYSEPIVSAVLGAVGYIYLSS